MSIFYGQFDPPVDKFIAEYFPVEYIGNCIEIGAADGVGASNTLYFENKKWNCICIEPNPSYFSQLQTNRKISLNCACSNIDLDDVEFTIYDLGNNQSAISSLRVDERLVTSHEHLIKEKFNIKVSIRKLDTILKELDYNQAIDFISIDTEGTELDVLKGFDINYWKPKLLVIENNFNDPEIGVYLETLGYMKDRRYEVNDFYIKIK